MKLKNEISPKIISVIFGIFVLLFALGFYVVAWEEPTSVPPTGNVYAPLNTGDSAQYKIGRLQIGNSDAAWMNDSITGFTEPVISNDGFVFVPGYTGAENSDLRLYMLDNFAERFSIWGDSCGGGDCGDLNNANLKHYFTGGGDAWHSSKMTAAEICLEGKGCKSDWSQITGSSYWTAGTGDNIYRIAGNVGIGTTNPTQKLTINGDIDMIKGQSSMIHSLGEISFDWTTGGSYDNPQYHGIQSKNETGGWSDNIRINSYNNLINTIDSNNNNGTSYFKIQHHSPTNGEDLFWVRSSDGNAYLKGNVGIGTASPDNKLEVRNGAIEIEYDNQDSKLRFHDPSNAWYSMGIDVSDSRKFKINYGGNVGDSSHFTMTTSGNVGIGTASPGEKLSVNGTLDMMNHKIKNVTEIDPVFGIYGKKYTSYMTDMVGQKIEVVGEAELEGDELVIDFELEKEGSDLWLFWQTSDRETIIPFVSVQSDAEIYAYIDGSEFIIRLRDGDENAKFSYRLIGTRLDHADDTDNLYDDQSVEYFIDIDELRK